MLSLEWLYPGDAFLGFVVVTTAAASVILCTACCVSRFLSRQAACRHGVLFSALVAALACPGLAALFAVTETSLVAIPLADKKVGIPAAKANTPTTTTHESPLHAADGRLREDVASPTFAAPPRVAQSTASAESDMSTTPGVLVLAMWSAGTILMALRTGQHFQRLRNLGRCMLPACDERVDAALAAARRFVAIREAPAVMISATARVPLAFGWRRPVIALPAGLIDGVSRDQLRDVLVHELAHIARRDPWVVLLQAIARAAYWPIPWVHLANRRLADAREDICDNYVLASRDAVSYGKTLLRVAELASGARIPRGAVSIADRSGKLEQRIGGLILNGRNTMTRFRPITALTLLAAFLAASTLLSAATFAPPEDTELKVAPSESDNANAASDAETEAETKTGASTEDDRNLPNADERQPAESKIIARVKTESGDTVSAGYLTLWRALEPKEGVPKSNVSGPAASNGIDYYQTVVWEDRDAATRWVRVGSAHPNDGRHGQDANEFQFEELSAGRYRVTAVSYRPDAETPDPTPCGMSETIELDGADAASVDVTLSKGDAALTLRIIDQESGQPIPRMALQLRGAAGMPIFHGHGTGNLFERTDDGGQVRFGSLPAGDYEVRVMGKAAHVNEFVEYAPLKEYSTVNLGPGDKLLEIGVPPRRLDQAEIDRRFPFSVLGQVTDEAGKPLPGAKVRAATGVGTLLGGGRTTADAEGRYRLYFGGGVGFRLSEAAPLGIGVQAVHLMVEAEGWELAHDDGYLFYLMTDSTPEQFQALLKEDGEVWGKSTADEVVFARQPHEVDFQMRRK